MFSIIVPIYNVAGYLEKCVASLLAQTVTDFEILLIDDGSTDHSFTVANSFTDSRIHVFHQENQGVSAARNVGLAAARGEFIVFVDPDDIVEPNHLAVFQQALSAGNFSFVLNEIYFDTVDGAVSGSHFGKNDREKNISLDKAIAYSSHGLGFLGILVNKVFRHDIIESKELRFDERVHQREDRLFNIEYLLAAKELRPNSRAMILDAPTYHYVTRESSQMNRVSAKTYSALYAQQLIEQKTNSISPAIKKWNKNKSLTETLYLSDFAAKNPEILDELAAPLREILEKNYKNLADHPMQTVFYLLTTTTLRSRQKLQLIRLFHQLKRRGK